MEKHFKDVAINFARNEIFNLNVAYLRLNNYLKGFLPFVPIRLLEIVPLYSKDMQRCLDGCASEKVAMGNLKHQSQEKVKQLIAFVDPNEELVEPEGEVDIATNVINRFDKFAHPKDNVGYQGEPTHTVSDYYQNIRKIALDGIKDDTTLPYIAEPAEPPVPPVYPTYDRIKKSPLLRYKLPVKLTTVVLVLLMIAEICLFQHIILNVFRIPDLQVSLPLLPSFYLPKSALIAFVVLAITISLSNAVYPAIYGLMRREEKFRTVQNYITLGLVVALLLVFVNGLLYYEYVAEGLANARQMRAIALDPAAYTRHIAVNLTGREDSLAWLRFLAISLASVVSILTSAILSSMLTIYKKANKMEKDIQNLNNQMSRCYAKHCRHFELFLTNRGLVHQILTKLKTIESINLTGREPGGKGPSINFLLPVFILIAATFSSCTESKKSDALANNSNGKTVIAVARDISGSIDTTKEAVTKKHLKAFLMSAIKSNSEATILYSNIESAMGLNNITKYRYQPIELNVSSNSVSENEREMNAFLIDQCRTRNRDSFANAFIERQFTNRGRSNYTSILEYLQLLSMLKKDFCSMSVIAVTDLLQDSPQFKLAVSDISTNQKAVAKAQRDLAKLYSMGMDSLSLGHITSFNVILPEYQTSKGFISPQVQVYWGCVLKGLGSAELTIYKD